MLLPELFVMVSSAVPHFLPPSLQVFPLFHENVIPLVGTLDVFEELLEPEGVLCGVLELDGLLCEVLELEALDEPPAPGVLEELPEPDELLELGGFSVLDVSDGSDGISEPSPPTGPTSVIPGFSEEPFGSSESDSSPDEPPEALDDTAELLCPISPRSSSPPWHPESVITAAKSAAAAFICTRFIAYFLSSLENSRALPRSPSTLSFPVV